MIDLHSHILWGIDDGSLSLEMSLQMLKMSADSGVTDIFATPHANRHGAVPEWPVVLDKINTLQEEADRASIPIHIHSGAEVELDYHILDFVREGSHDYCLNGSDYILVELTRQSRPPQVEELLYELMLRGFTPVLAHPERYDHIMSHPDQVLEWMRHGLLLQSNLGSFTGFFGDSAQHLARELQKRGLISFLGSDAHRTNVRTTDTSPGREAIVRLQGGQALWDRCIENSQKLLQNKVIYPEVPDSWDPPKKGFLPRLFGKL
jgi:protein-tyrosine phosphatase